MNRTLFAKNQNRFAVILLFTVLLIIESNNVHAKNFVTSPTDYFRSVNNGDWSSPATWQSSSNNINWSAATTSPTSSANTITIQVGNTINVTSNISLDQTIINGVLEIQLNGILSINNGNGDDIIINSGGILRTLGTSAYTTQIVYAASSNINILPGGKIIVGDGTATVSNNFDGFATDGKNTWNNGSVFEWNNLSSFGTNSLTYFQNNTPLIKPIFRITKVGATVGSSNPTTINGILEVNYNTSFTGSGTKILRDGITGTATLTLGGTGTININSSSAILGGTNLTLILNKTLNANSGLTTPAASNVKIDNNSTTGLNIGGGNFTIASGATFDIGSGASIAISSNNIIVNGIFKTANANGLSGLGGTSVPSNRIILNTGSTVEYYSSFPQSISIRSDYYNLILSGGSTKTPFVSNTIAPINGTVTIPDNTIVDVGSNTFGSASTNFTMLNGRFRCSGVLTKPDMSGTYNLTGGVVEFYNSAGTPQSINSKSYYNIEITGSNVRNSNGNLELNNGGSFTIKNGGVFSINDEAIIGPNGLQTVNVENGGTFKTGDVDGFSGGSGLTATSIRNDVENINLLPGSTVEYDRNTGNQLVTARTDYSNLTISGNANKTFTGNTSVAGNFVAGSNIITAPPIMRFIGITTTQDISGIIYNDIIFSGSAQKRFTSNGSLSGTLSMSGNNISLDADGVANNVIFTLKSTATFTARIDDLTNGNTNSNNIINGNVTVERCIPIGRKWRFLSVPFSSSAQTIKEAWQENQTNPDVYTQINNSPGYGTEITFDNNINHGFDVNNTTNPSIKTWNNATQKWSLASPFTNSTNITAYTAYCLFVRGSRAVNLSQGVYANKDATTLRAKGVLKQGNVTHTFNGVQNGNFVFVGNPYPSSINFNSFSSLNSAVISPNNFYVWDPKIAGNYGVGSFVNYNSMTGWSNTSGSYSAISPPVIQSGQAFFVTARTANGNINFKESDKVAAQFNVFGKPTDQPIIYIRLNVPSSDGLINIDGAVAGFGNFSSSVDDYDARKMYGFNENISFIRDSQNLAVELRPLAKQSDTLFINLSSLKQFQEYNLEVIPKNIPFNLFTKALLIDKYLNKQISINLNDTVLYNFKRDSSFESYKNRFIIIISRKIFIATAHKVNNVETQKYSNEKPSILVYPNPTHKQSKMQLKFNNIESGKYTISIKDINGDIVASKIIFHKRGSNSYSLSFSKRLITGQFLINVDDINNHHFETKLVISD